MSKTALPPLFSQKTNPLPLSELGHLPRPRLTTLPNGMIIASEQIPTNRHSATVGVLVKTGSRYESPEENGIAHFLEHLAFKGTQKRSRVQLETQVENMGAHLNAYTSREYTNYFASLPKSQVPQAVDILHDILCNSKLSHESIERERETILAEYDHVYADKEEYVHDYLHECAYPDSSLGQTTLGTKQNIQSIDREQIVRYLQKFYTPDRMILAAAGAVDHAELVQAATEKFGALSPSPRGAVEMSPAQYRGSDYKERQDEMPLVHFALAYEIGGWNDPDIVPLYFINYLIGSMEKDQVGTENSSSRLVSTASAYKFAEKVKPFITPYMDTGLFGIYAEAYEMRLAEVQGCVLKSFNDMIHYVTDDQVEEIRNRVMMGVLSMSEGTNETYEDLSRQIFVRGRKIPHEENLERIQSVDAAAVKRAARRFFHDKDHAMAMVGPSIEAYSYNRTRRRSYNLFK